MALREEVAMFGLFKNSYDYYEWHDLVCVSTSESSLQEHYKSLGSNCPLLSEAEQVSAAMHEEYHYVIEPIVVV